MAGDYAVRVSIVAKQILADPTASAALTGDARDNLQYVLDSALEVIRPLEMLYLALASYTGADANLTELGSLAIVERWSEIHDRGVCSPVGDWDGYGHYLDGDSVPGPASS
jgi:hypothetical protein